jgi:predicted RNA-binding protein
MCLSTVYMENNGQMETVMQDVSHMVAKDGGMLLTGMFGEEIFINGRLKNIDFLEGESILMSCDSTETR